MKPSISLIRGMKPSRTRRPASPGSVTPSYRRTVAYIAPPRDFGRGDGLMGHHKSTTDVGQRPRDSMYPRVIRVSARRSGRGREAGLEDWGCLEPLDDRIDPERQLPEELRDCRDGLRRAASGDYVEHHPDPRDADERARDEPQHRQASRHQAGTVHQVTQD